MKRGDSGDSKRANKQIIISILPAIPFEMDKEKFVSNLEMKIYSELDKIN